MPIITNQRLYQLFFRSAQTVIARPGRPAVATRMVAGRPWYRYVAYRRQMAQPADAGRSQFRTLDTDTGNRWTGTDTQGGGRQGLYFSEEFLNAGDPFPELTHYQEGPDVDSRGLVSYYRYNRGLEPALQVTEATNLRSMFLFSRTTDINGMDLRLRTGPNTVNPLLEAIHAQAMADPEFGVIRAAEPNLDLTNLETLYRAERADFCRAVGNAALAEGDVDFLRVSSVRDIDSANIVARTPNRNPGDPVRVVDGIVPEGRATFFVDGDGHVGQSAFTVSDLIYNATFEAPGTPPVGLPPVEVVTARLVEVQQAAINTLTGELETVLATHPGSNQLNGIVEAVQTLQTHIQAGANPAEVGPAIEALRTQIGALGDTPPAEFERVLALSESVAGSLEAMNEAIDAAAHEQDVDPPDAIDDPDPSELDVDGDPVNSGGGHG
ncbi:hypothetical protein [Leptothoe sp. PORK10 BA2]|uniref:hypothetical protein n=1 Tax=Leptothoe sp. PORK10 BA2 TaxID=3110254 RepID=UPI002B218AE7|nr:hypothetical protein [Leptothoe sp. PORK10 BA2]MEA5464222.1 hypothetical protein [Leptothoe sp. PORK10 BA2]